MRLALIKEVIKWHKEDWRGNAYRALCKILSLEEQQVVIYETENIWVCKEILKNGWSF